MLIRAIIILMLMCSPCFGSIDLGTTNDYLDCGDITDMEGVANLSISAWVKLSTQDEFDEHIGERENNNSRFLLGLGGSGFGDNNDLDFAIGNVSNSIGYSNSNLITTGVWQHWVGTYDGNGSTNDDKVKIYINGDDQGPLGFFGTIPSTTADNPASFQIGGANLNAEITDVALWSATLTADEVSLLYSSKKKRIVLQIQPDSLIGYWPLDDVRDGKDSTSSTFVNIANPGTWDCSGSGDDITSGAEEILNYP